MTMDQYQFLNYKRSSNSPSSLMRRSQASSIVSVEELMEEHVIPKVRVTIQLLVTAVGRTTTLHVTPENVDKPVLNFLGNLGKVHIIATAGRTFYLEVTSVVLMEPLQ